MDRFTKEANARDRVVMNKITNLERAQKPSYIPKGNPFPKNKIEEDRSSSSQIQNTLAPTNVVGKNTSSDDEESEDEQIDEQANLVEADVFNIFLVGSYTHPPISEVTLKEEKE